MTNDQITVSRALLQQAIDALSDTQTDGESPQWDIEKAAYDALRTALEQPAVEPIPLAATCHCACVVEGSRVVEYCKMHGSQLIAAPQAQQEKS